MKESNIILQDAKKLQTSNWSNLVNLETFTKALNKKPAVVKANKFANNSQYVPISHIQTLLDQMFFGLWQTKSFSYKVIANELVGSIELWVFHPSIKEWLVRTGVAATQIRQHKGAKLTDIDQKIKNALEMDAAHLYADCVKSAAKTLGPAFGRDLNRDFVDNYKALVSNYVQSNTYTAKEVKETLTQLDNISDVLDYWETQPIWQQDPKIIALFEERKKDIQDEQF
jgi:hypothetical protein